MIKKKFVIMTWSMEIHVSGPTISLPHLLAVSGRPIPRLLSVSLVAGKVEPDVRHTFSGSHH